MSSARPNAAPRQRLHQRQPPRRHRRQRPLRRLMRFRCVSAAPSTRQPKPVAAPAPLPSPTRSAAPVAIGNAVFPSAIDPKYSNESAGKARMETCLDQYNANKANNANGGLKWIQRGGGYYSECVKRLKGQAYSHLCSPKRKQAMPSKFAEMTSRNFSPKLAPELSDEARKAVNAAFDAMSTWRTETVDNFEIVIDKMAAAARALGWPQQIVDATHAQMQDVIKMQ